MSRIEFDVDAYNLHLDTLPGEKAQGLEQFVQQCFHEHHPEALLKFPFMTATYTDSQGRDWQYWPLSAADQMWSEVKCNQPQCRRPAMFIGVVDVIGDGTPYYDAASAWCLFCMPREAMTPEAEHMRRHADWARQVGVDECLAFVREFRGEADWNPTLDASLTRLISDLRSVTETREQVLAYSILSAEYLDGRMHTPEMRYAVRPGSGMESALLCAILINVEEIPAPLVESNFAKRFTAPNYY